MTNPFWFGTRGHFIFPYYQPIPKRFLAATLKPRPSTAIPFVQELIEKDGWLVWPLVPFRYDTINYDLKHPAPAPPSVQNYLGTDDQARDVTARLIYGFRLSVLFALALTAFSSVVGIAAGAVQGYLGGWVDLIFQRFIEIWGGLPTLFIIIIIASIIEPTFWTLLVIMLLFSLDAPRRCGTRRVFAGAQF